VRRAWGTESRWRLHLALGCAALGCGALSLTSASAGAASRGDSGFTARGSVQQVYATGLPSRARVRLLNADGRTIDAKRATGLGGVLFRHVKPGPGYRVRLAGGGERSGPLRVLSKRSAPPNTNVYNQQIDPDGYQYLKTRDGTRLAIYVHPPQDVTDVTGVHAPPAPSGPTPTLIEYSGYGYANPAGPESGIAILANLMGFTVVDVNMRGTGCSGGAFDFFEPLQSLDGYDVIETISRQPWVLHHKVGMMGISYGGISQLFTAQTDPPHLAAISPLSVIDQTQTTLYPGGILNTGFAVEWAKERAYQAKPASPNGGQAWAYERIQEGDRTCRANQALHGEAADLLGKIRANDHYRAKVADPLSPITFVDKIKVPVFMACQWTDEQTGGHCPDLADRFTGTRRKWFTFTNGTHVDSLAPETFNRWYDFLQLFVAKQAPITRSAFIQGAGPVIYQAAMGIPGVTMPPDPIQRQPTYEGALRMFMQQKPVRILFDNGAGGTSPGQPKPGFERSFDRLPIPGVRGRSWYLSPKGALRGAPRARRNSNSFTWDADARPLTNFTGDTGTGGLWTATPDYHWSQNPAGSAVSYLTRPLRRDTTAIGAGAVRVWVRSSTPNVDLQATITEVRPDGMETFVQGGWVRGNERKLDRRKSTPLEPVLSLRQRDVKPLPSDRHVKVTIPLYFEGHAYRAGSRIRVIISAPNGDQPIWSFGETRPKGTSRVSIAYSKRKRSRLTLPIVPGVGVPTDLPPCPGLRGEPCRDYKPFSNRGG
jgi:predicted acyl esterase